jgi:transcriptional regulator GlxA family with amidase domain
MDRRIQAVVAIIEAEQSDGTRLSDLARAVNLSVWHLSHLFRRELHASIVSYRRMRRLAKAEHLLRSTFFSVKEIMITVGVRDKSHFTREFTKAYGFPPTQYRHNRASDQTQLRSRKVG